MRRSRLLSLLAPALLAVVACTQLVLAHTTPLTPWKLGGFGMFSTLDNSRTRTVRLHLVTDDGTFAVAGPRGARGTRAWPRGGALRAQALRAACGRWRTVPLDAIGPEAELSPSWRWVYGDAARRAQSGLSGLAVAAERGAAGVAVRAVRAEVVRIRFDDGALVPEVIATEAVDVPEACP